MKNLKTIALILLATIKLHASDVDAQTEMNISTELTMGQGAWQVAGGTSSGLLLGYLGVRWGFAKAKCDGENKQMLCGLGEAFIGGILGLNLGVASGIYLTGNIQDKKGSYLSTFLMGALSTASALGILYMYHRLEIEDKLGTIVLMISVPTVLLGGPMLGYNYSHKKRVEAGEVNLTIDSKGRPGVAANLLRVTF